MQTVFAMERERERERSINDECFYSVPVYKGCSWNICNVPTAAWDMYTYPPKLCKFF